MFKMWSILKKNQKGLASVEMSVLMPFILLLSAGILFILFFLLDMAIVKGSCIYQAESIVDELNSYVKDNMTKEDFIKQEKRELRKLLKERVNVAQIKNCDIQYSSSKIIVTVTIVMSWPWKALREYLGEGLCFKSVTKSVPDKRKEWKWMENLIEER